MQTWPEHFAVLDDLSLPEPPYTPDDKAEVAQLVYRHIWQQSARPNF